MRRVSVLLAILCLGAAGRVGAQTASSPVAGVVRPDGTPVRWSGWVERRAPAAVLLWASWTPRADAVLAEVPALVKVCRNRGLRFVLIDVGEPLDEASRALSKTKVDWLHDRHGSILKRYRVVQVPRIVILGRDGRVLAKLKPEARAVAGWKGR